MDLESVIYLGTALVNFLVNITKHFKNHYSYSMTFFLKILKHIIHIMVVLLYLKD